MLGAIRRLLGGTEDVSWLQPLPTAAPVDRRELILGLCAGRRVIHLGFTDERQTEAKLRDGRWLHAALAEVSGELVGLDVDAVGVEWATSAGYEAYVVDVQDPVALADLALAPADVVVAGEIIEHVESAGGFLRAVASLLKADGRLVVTTPNAYRLPGFLAPVLGEELIHPDHVAIHSIHTLRTLGTRCGYRVDRLGYYQNNAVVSASPVGRLVKIVRGAQSLVLRRWPHWSDGIYAIYALPEPSGATTP
jgi:SAM-dependent methyltransferase